MKLRRVTARRERIAALSIFTSLLFALAPASPSRVAHRDGGARQSTQPRPAPAPDQKPAPTEIAPSYVLLNFIALDANGRALDDVRREDVRLTEDGAPQTVAYFARDESPLACGVVVDSTGSMRGYTNVVVDALRAFLAESRPGDEAFVERFVSSDKITLLEDFTSDRDALGDALDDIYIEGGLSAVVDAVYVAAQHAAAHDTPGKKYRPVLLLVTDGEDRGSARKPEELTKLLRETGVQVFAVGLVNDLSSGGFTARSNRRQRATDLLDAIAKESGGRAYFPKSLADLPSLLRDVSRAMRTQYVVGYTPTNAAADGKFRKVEVKLASGQSGGRRFAVARPGYLAPGKDAAAK